MGHPLAAFSVVFVAALVQVSQAQNQAPVWDETSYASLSNPGIPEGAPVGTVVATLRCTDPEGQTVGYNCQSGCDTFRLNRATGVLTTAINITVTPRESETGINVVFECFDILPSGRPRPQTEWTPARTKWSVNDINDKPPTFETANREGYFYEISEDAQPGQALTPVINIRDGDYKPQNVFLDSLYFICNSPDPAVKESLPESSIRTCEKFAITFVPTATKGLYTATVELIAPLDYETFPVYNSILVAVDGQGNVTKQTGQTTIQITVEDAQDQLPEFTNPGTSVSVSESVAPGTTLAFGVSARDGDRGASREVLLEIIEDPRGLFSLGPASLSLDPLEVGVYTSRLIVVNQLDRENITESYALVVRATELDGTVDPPARTDATATATYSVFVTDVNDNRPEFEEEVINHRVTELTNIDPQNYVPGTISGLHIICVDRDEGSNADYTVRIVNQTFPQAFSIFPVRSSFRGTAHLFIQVDNFIYMDYDVPAYRRQTIVLEAREVQDPSLPPSYCTVNIILQDINDNRPIFPLRDYTLSVSESVNVFPYSLYNFTVTDADSDQTILFSLEQSVPDKFDIVPSTGELRLLEAVDYEANPQYVFLVVATDQAVDPKTGSAQVTVQVLDFNDIGPRFTQNSWQTSANETSLFFLNPVTIRAVDDENPDQAITYRIVSGQSPNNAFVINNVTGVLSLVDFLDYDQTPLNSNNERSGFFNLVVEASDNGLPTAQTSTVPVGVRVIDENNHPPVVNPVVYRASISELAPGGTSVAKIEGTDRDGGAFGQLSFRLGPGSSNNFQVNQFSGLVTVAGQTNFDFDSTRSYRLTILATDGGAPQLTATATVFVDITNANNKDPVFPEFFYTARVNDRTAVGTVVLTLTATDGDGPTMQRLLYTIIPGSIQASDGDGNPLRPNNFFDYDFTTAFAINNATGAIFVNGPLNKDAAQEITFKVQVEDVNSDSGPQIDDAQVTIIVEGEPDNTISIDPVPVMSVDEDEDIGHSIVALRAEDPITRRVVTNFEKMRGSSDFLNLKGDRVVLARKLNYETGPRELTIAVRAISDDGTRSATATVTVSVLDVNNNAPRFQQSAYIATVSENARYPDFVTRIVATDPDSSSFGPIDYRITSGLDAQDFTLFKLPQVDGVEVLVNEGVTLDYNRRAEYNLVVEAVDNAEFRASATRLTSSVLLTINVIDENNNRPTFRDATLRNVVPETAEIGQNISVVQAYDADAGENGRIRYSLQAFDENSREGLNLFGISPSQGRVFVIGSLLGQGGRDFKFRVQARDNGVIPNIGTMTLEISILSTKDNDGTPKWNAPPVNYIVYAPEEQPGYQLKDLVFSVSPQTGTNITYSLSEQSEGYSSFSIDPITGLITILDSLDREVKPQYEILVNAIDTNNTLLLRSGRTFIVALLDKNDNDATFTNPRGYPACGSPIDRPLVVPVVENTPANTTIYTMSACDADGAGNNSVTYTPYENNTYCAEQMRNSAIRIRSDGRLVTDRILDYEQRREYILCVLATSTIPAVFGRRKRAVDMTLVPNSPNVAIVVINVTDVNDHGPEFPRPVEVAVVYSSPGEGAIHQLDAVDKDGPGYNSIRYQIMSSFFYPPTGDRDSASIVGEAFKIRGNRGLIYATWPTYQRYVGGRFVLTIDAIDSVDPTKKDTQTLNVYVYKRGDALKFVLDQSPATGKDNGELLISQLNGLSSRYVMTFLSASENRLKDGVNLDKTDVCFIAADLIDNEMLNIRQVLDLLRAQRYQDVLNLDEYRVESTGKCFRSIPSEERVKWRDLWWVLVAVAVFVFVCCIICLVLIAILYENYKRYMESKKTYLVQQ